MVAINPTQASNNAFVLLLPSLTLDKAFIVKSLVAANAIEDEATIPMLSRTRFALEDFFIFELPQMLEQS